MIQLKENFDIEALRRRLRRMDDAMVLRWGRAAAALADQRKVFRLQAEAARDEWRRRQVSRRGGDRKVSGDPVVIVRVR
jgi:hypothetical protein